MAAGTLKAVVATSTLDLGIDWGDVDLVIHVGAPKGASRLIQRIGRANHRLDEPSQAILVPANRFEVLECRAARRRGRGRRAGCGAVAPRRARRAGAARAGHGVRRRRSIPDALFAEVRSALALCGARARRASTASSISSRPAATRCKPTSASPSCGRRPTARCGSRTRASSQHYRLNAGTIVEAPLIKVRLLRRASAQRRAHGAWSAGACWARSTSISSSSCAPATPSCSAGEVLRFEGMSETEAFVSARQRPRSDHPELRQAASFRCRRTSPSACARCWPTAHAWRGCRCRSPSGSTLAAATARVIPRPRRGADRDLPARRPALSRRLPVRGPARPPDARHAADAPARPRRRRARWASSPTTTAWRCGGSATSPASSPPAGSTSAQLFAEDMLGDDLDAWLAEVEPDEAHLPPGRRSSPA